MKPEVKDLIEKAKRSQKSAELMFGDDGISDHLNEEEVREMLGWGKSLLD